jgi:predicted ribosomally synthesized peptide with nif11-like leader
MDCHPNYDGLTNDCYIKTNSKQEKTMSIESAKAFYERMATDETFRLQHQNAKADGERRQLVQGAGYDFTPEEWESALAEIAEAAKSQLSDAELESVAGGIKFIGYPPTFPWTPKFPTAFPMYGISLPGVDNA